MAVKILKKTLVKLNCNVVTAFNGFEACNIMETMGNVFDVILMDLRMPIMDGHSVS
jgi:CheY-like chemotaxis protein